MASRSEMKASDWIAQVDDASTLEELQDVLDDYTASGADYTTVESAIEAKRAELSGEEPSEEEGDDAEEKEEDDGRAKLAMGDPLAGQTPDPDAVAEAEAEAEEQAESGKSTGEAYEEKSLIRTGTWVVLADTPRVPKEVVGHEAFITNAPVAVSDGDEQIPFRHEYTPEDATFTVQTRDQYAATIVGLTLEDFSEISTNGRAGVMSAG